MPDGTPVDIDVVHPYGRKRNGKDSRGPGEARIDERDFEDEAQQQQYAEAKPQESKDQRCTQAGVIEKPKQELDC